MKTALLVWLVALFACLISQTAARRQTRSVSLGDVIGNKPAGTRRKKPIKVTPPLRLKPGETAERPPGWQHCIKNIKAGLSWKSIKSPGYPDFLESQIQCSWIIEAPIGMRVKLAFRDLDMIGFSGSCAKQFVQIIDIGTGKSQGRFCGSSRPGDYVSLGTKARIDLQADKAVTKVRGFLLSFAAVNEIPGFRASKIFPSMGKSSEGAPGKVNVKNFLSSSKQAPPKPSTTKRRGNKRLVYESDLTPKATDPSATTTESASANQLDSEDDLGWIGDDEQLTNGGQSRNNGNRRRNSPAKVFPTNQRPPGQRPTPRQSNGLLTFSTLPVRIRASPPPASKTRKPNVDGSDPVIYGVNNQPHDPNHYTTLHPVRLEPGRLVDHRGSELSTTNLIIIIACAVLFVMIVVGMGAFLWLLRKRQKRRRKIKKATDKKRKEEEDEKRERMELNVARLFEENPQHRTGLDRPNFLPGQSAMTRGETSRRSTEIHFSNQRNLSRSGSFGRTDGYGGSFRRHGVTFEPGDERRARLTSDRDSRKRSGVTTVSGPKIGHSRKMDRNIDPTQAMRFHSLDPRSVGARHALAMTDMRYSGDYPKRNTMPDPNQYHRHNSNAAVEDVDEDYCSGSESGSGKAPMRREYSQWELEQHKKDRRKKLMSL